MEHMVVAFDPHVHERPTNTLSTSSEMVCSVFATDTHGITKIITININFTTMVVSTNQVPPWLIPDLPQSARLFRPRWVSQSVRINKMIIILFRLNFWQSYSIMSKSVYTIWLPLVISILYTKILNSNSLRCTIFSRYNRYYIYRIIGVNILYIYR